MQKRLIKKASSLPQNVLNKINGWIKQVKDNDYEPIPNDHQEDHHLEFKNNFPYKQIAWGSGRMVFDFGDVVLKVAATKQGIEVNKEEVSAYQNSPDDLKSSLAKVYEHGDGWLTSEKLTKDVPKTEEYKEIIYKLEEKFLAAGIKPDDLTFSHDHSEPHWSNFKLNSKGDVIIVDSGNFKQNLSSNG